MNSREELMIDTSQGILEGIDMHPILKKLGFSPVNASVRHEEIWTHKIGEKVITARRSGATWTIGGIAHGDEM